MNKITTITFIFVLFIAQVCHGQYNGRIRNNLHSLNNMHRDLSLSCTCDDLSTLVALVRALEDRECGSGGHAPSGGISNAEDLIMNLVNALITLTTQALSHNCHCPNQSGNNHPHYPNNGGNNLPNHNGGNSHSDGGLLNVDLLNPNKKDNVLDLDVAKQHLLGVGLGGGNSQSSNGLYTNIRNSNGGNDEGLINVDLLNPNKKNNVADVHLGKQDLVGVGLGGGGKEPSQTSTNTNSNAVSSSNSSNTSEGLINVDLLNPNKQNNIADVDIARQTVLGIGLGNKNDG